MCVCVCMYDPAYSSQQLNDFLGSWKISHTTSIHYNPQGLAIVERTNRAIIKELLARTVSPQARRDHYLNLTKVLF